MPQVHYLMKSLLTDLQRTYYYLHFTDEGRIPEREGNLTIQTAKKFKKKD